MIIRPYQAKDQSAVVQLWLDCGLVVSHNNPVRDIKRKSSVNPEWFLIGEIGDRVVASCMAGYEGHRGWINYLAVAPTEQNKQHASLLMARAEELLRKAGCPKISLQIRSTNRRVIEFYEKLGFCVDDVICMGKRLERDE